MAFVINICNILKVCLLRTKLKISAFKYFLLFFVRCITEKPIIIDRNCYVNSFIFHPLYFRAFIVYSRARYIPSLKTENKHWYFVINILMAGSF